MGLSKNKGYLNLGGPYNKDPTIKGTILGSPIFGNPHMYLLISLGTGSLRKAPLREPGKTQKSDPTGI